MKTYRSLSVGNSFSQDALMFCHDIAAADGIEWETVNLVVGGCELHRHWQYWFENDPHYALEINGKWVRNEVTIKEMLEDGTYDIITTQQASHHSGRPETYFPFVVDLCRVFREYQPDAKLYLQETWAYEWDSTHGAFPTYNNDQREMYDRLKIAYAAAAIAVKAQIIPTGDVIQHFRENVTGFDYRNGGMSLNRDGFHLNMPYGRYINSAVWYSVLFDADIRKNTFIPENAEDKDLMERIKEEIYAYLHR